MLDVIIIILLVVIEVHINITVWKIDDLISFIIEHIDQDKLQ